jgi:hypothetical protein
MSKQILVLNSIRGKSGKDTLIALLESKGYRCHRVAFADILKKQCASELACTSDQAAEFEAMMHRSAKDDQLQYLSISNIPQGAYLEWLCGHTDHDQYAPRSLRWHLQQYGTEYVRNFLGKQSRWLDLGLKEIHEGIDKADVDIVVVTDCRLPNELKALEDLRMVYQTVTTVRIVRDWFIPGVDDQPYHISDIALMASHFDHLVVNKLGEPWGMLDQLSGVV